MTTAAGNGRVVVLVDMDCFYVQVEQQLVPDTAKLPCAVVQYNAWRGGSVLAVDYTARRYGVTRGMTGKEAIAKCPQLHLFRVPEKRGKADLTRYRHVGAKVIQVLSQFCDQVERASVDEAFLELTSLPSSPPPSAEDIPDTKVAGWYTESGEGEISGAEGDERLLRDWLEKEGRGEERSLALAAALVGKMREAIRNETGCTCSAGVAHNKMLAKLAAGMNKPNGQTILPASCVARILSTTPIRKIRHLGGKLGSEIAQNLNIINIGQLCDITMQTLQSMFGIKTGSWLYELCRGKDGEIVRARQLPQSLGCGKNFPGPAKLKTVEQVKHWLSILSSELVERLEEDKQQNRRYARQLSVHFQSSVCAKSMSHCCALPAYNSSRVATAAWASMENHCKSLPSSSSEGLTQLSLSANKFTNSSSQTLHSYLQSPMEDSPMEDSPMEDLPSVHLGKRSRQESKTENKQQKVDAAGPSEVPLPALGEGFPAEVLEMCCECGERVPVWQLGVHQDHHLAMKLQSQEDAVKPAPASARQTLQTLDRFFHKK